MSQLNYTNKDRDKTVTQLNKVKTAVEKGYKTEAIKLLDSVRESLKTLQPHEQSNQEQKEDVPGEELTDPAEGVGEGAPKDEPQVNSDTEKALPSEEGDEGTGRSKGSYYEDKGDS